MTDLHSAGPGGDNVPTDTPASTPVTGGPSQAHNTSGDTPPSLSTGSRSASLKEAGSHQEPSHALGLSPDNQALFEKKGWKDINDALSSYDALSRKLGSTLSPPDETASPEDWQNFYERLGCPSTAEGYDFSLPEGLPEEFPYDTESADAFKGWAKQAGLTQKQADNLHGEYVRMQAAQFDEMNQRFTQAENDAHIELTKAWGEENTENYQQHIGHARAALNGAGEAVETALFNAGLLSEDGHLRDASIGQWLARLGANYYSDDSFATGNAAGISNNPFMRDENGKTNLTAEARAIKADPERAKALIRAAGREEEFAPYLK